MKKIDVSAKSLIINISGYDLLEIETLISIFEDLKFNKLILQIGFQNYPTNIEDTSLNKIKILRKKFKTFEICYADHLDSTDDFAKVFPTYAILMGCNYIEKHVCLNRKSSLYDYEAALELDEFKYLINLINKLNTTREVMFTTEKEKFYLNNTIQK